MFVPLFIERRLLCKIRERRQGNTPVAADDGSSTGATGVRLVKRRAEASRSGARQADPRGALRSLLADDPASKTENGRAQGAHHSPPQIRLADRQTYSGYENQAVGCRSVDLTLSLWPCFPRSTRGGNQTHFRNGRARWNHLAISGRAPTASETGKANPCHSEL